LLNHVQNRMEVCESDLFQAVEGQRFELVLFNTPYFSGMPAEAWEQAWKSPDVIDRFAREFGRVLAPGGRALVVISSLAVGVDRAIRDHGIDSNVVWEQDMVSERLTVLEWRPGEAPPR
jgi:release factor glutamine methyltransferase